MKATLERLRLSISLNSARGCSTSPEHPLKGPVSVSKVLNSRGWHEWMVRHPGMAGYVLRAISGLHVKPLGVLPLQRHLIMPHRTGGIVFSYCIKEWLP